MNTFTIENLDLDNAPMREAIAYVVINDCALGYLQKIAGGFVQMGILGRNLNGLQYSDSRPYTLSSIDILRYATAEDFETFRVYLGKHDLSLRIKER